MNENLVLEMYNSDNEQRFLKEMLDLLKEELVDPNIVDNLKLYSGNYNERRQKVVDCGCDERQLGITPT
jgi:hypothetical protein